MTHSNEPKRITFLIHILVWIFIAIVIFVVSPLSWKVDLPLEYWFKQGLVLFFLILLFYLNMYLFVPKVLFKGMNWQFILIEIPDQRCVTTFNLKTDQLQISIMPFSPMAVQPSPKLT